MSSRITTRKSIDSRQLVLKKTLEVVGGKWRLCIIYQLGTEVRRYAELRRSIPLVSEKILIQELKALINLGVVEKTVHKDVSSRVEYGLTDKGRKVLPILLKLTTVAEIFLEP